MLNQECVYYRQLKKYGRNINYAWNRQCNRDKVL